MDVVKSKYSALKSEFKRLLWPSKENVAHNSAAAVVMMIVTSAAVYGLDALAQMAMGAIIKMM